MDIYYGTKKIVAQPMTRGEYNAYRKWEIPANENPADQGYLVEYTDGGKANVEGHAGYVSWSPKDVFDAAYKTNGAMNFGHALIALHEGKKVSRAGWNGKNMFLIYVPGTKDAKLKEGTPYEAALKSNIVTINPHIDMYTATGEFQPGWLASQTDILAEDWQLVLDGAEKQAA